MENFKRTDCNPRPFLEINNGNINFNAFSIKDNIS